MTQSLRDFFSQHRQNFQIVWKINIFNVCAVAANYEPGTRIYFFSFNYTAFLSYRKYATGSYSRPQANITALDCTGRLEYKLPQAFSRSWQSD